MQQNRREFLFDSARLGAFALAGPAVWNSMARTTAQRELATMSIAELSNLLASGRITSRRLVEQSLAAIRNPVGEGARTFLVVHEKEALAEADRMDAERRRGAKLPLLAGIPISIKDLFDEAGIVTLGGSRILVGAPPALRDSTVVTRLKNAGAIIVGRTNLVEFAYSGIGINPHYGTPKNAWDRAAGRIPGGSSSGAVVSVTDGMVAAAIGSDTGGSIRIPAALNGVVGFKPTARRVPLEGVLPLAKSLDSAGPIAKTVADCALIDQVLAADASAVSAPANLRGLRFAVPKTVVQDDLAPAVATAFAAALGRLSAAGATVVDVPMAELAQAAVANPRGALGSYEAVTFHQKWLKDQRDRYDPRVLARMKPGEETTAERYAELLQLRQRFIEAVNAAMRGYDAMLMPTVPDLAPTIAEAGKDDDTYFRINGRLLRNTSIVNLFDGCALSLPCQEPGTAPVGFTIAGTQDTDRTILAIGLAAEPIIARRRR
jgi:aspartyl-tRNA(Asn)/glutamyl-tRNA(Gln) amidotransferase subunit A